MKINHIFLDFKLSPCFICNAFSFGYLPGTWTPGRYPKENALQPYISSQPYIYLKIKILPCSKHNSSPLHKKRIVSSVSVTILSSYFCIKKITVCSGIHKNIETPSRKNVGFLLLKVVIIINLKFASPCITIQVK